jgi:DNA-directed RNA polymerase II subunit RPB2
MTTLHKNNDSHLPRIWKLIEQYFHDYPRALANHHIDSFNDFLETGVQQVFRDNNPLTIVTKFDGTQYRHQCNLYFGGKNGDKIYYGAPTIHDKQHAHYMFPNEARLRNMTYGMTIHYDVECEFTSILDDNQPVNYMNETYLQLLAKGEIEHEEVDDTENNRESIYITDTTDGKRKKIKTTPTNIAKIRAATEGQVMQGIQTRRITLEKILLGRFPIMLQSKMCILNGMTREHRWSCGECRNDIGGYFIIDGKEKVIIPQEKLADNMLNIRLYEKEDEDENENATPNPYLCSVEIRSVSENIAKPRRNLSIRMVAPTPALSNKHMVVSIPNVRKPVPLFILFRALGIISDKSIITTCLLDLDKNATIMDTFIPSIHDAGCIVTQQSALYFIARLTKYKTVEYAHEILNDYFLPHVGESNYIEKAHFLGYMTIRLLRVHHGMELPTERDNFKYKRIETSGNLIRDLFREYFTIQKKTYFLKFEYLLNYNMARYETALDNLILSNYENVFNNRVIENGFRKAFKGNWGSASHTKREGVIQDLNRLSFNATMSHLRKVCLPMDASLKVVEPRLLHSSQWGFIDPLDTPDGGNIGFHKSLAVSATISRVCPREDLLQWMKKHLILYYVATCPPKHLANLTKVFLNGYWIGCIQDPIDCVNKMKLYRRHALLPILTSVAFDIASNTIHIYCDEGRICRPVFYQENGVPSILQSSVKYDNFSWNQLISGFLQKQPDVQFNPYLGKLYKQEELYENVQKDVNISQVEKYHTHKAVIDYIDCNETEHALIQMHSPLLHERLPSNSKLKTTAKAKSSDSITSVLPYTHCEIHDSLIFGVMCNQIAFPESNQAPRNLFSCGQSKQASSMYHTNFQVRMDKSAIVLNYGQTPLVKSRYSSYFHRDENVYGENAIVAIACYTGYNVEDAILINQAALDRGLFRTTYYNTYEACEEETETNNGTTIDKLLTNPHTSNMQRKAGLDYDKLDDYGIVREGTYITEDTVLICMSGTNSKGNGPRYDCSITPKKGQLGIVDKTFVTEGDEGERIIKVRVLEQRIATMGDKFASRVGQKGTIGLVIPERNMPYTKDGLIPDMIINPHALPTRMTIGQIVECIAGKACAIYGGTADCTAFEGQNTSVDFYGKYLVNHRQKREREDGSSVPPFHSSGNEIFYNGMTGQQMEMEIFVGPTYYMRLKHMVKDKINYRSRGDNALLTRQPVGGRANDGGLRIGEMERDVVSSHGASEFLRESMMERADKYYMAICNKTGMLAVYNPNKNLFLSPSADGPLKYHVSNQNEDAIKIEQMSRFGRNFSIICIPYSLKLLMQELQCMNIQMRIITEDNIDQLENLVGEKHDLDSRNLGSMIQDIYGWKSSFDEATMTTKWTHSITGTVMYRTPPIVRAYKEILKNAVYEDYKVGDMIYYLEPSIVNGEPNHIWTITSMDNDNETLELKRSTETLENVAYNIHQMRLYQKNRNSAISMQGFDGGPINTNMNAQLSDIIQQNIGDTIYGWTKTASKKYDAVYWHDSTVLQRPSTWTEPEELVRRREILSLPIPKTCFSSNDMIYDLTKLEKYMDQSVDIHELERIYQVDGSYFDSQLTSQMLKIHDEIEPQPFNKYLMRLVPRKENTVEQMNGKENTGVTEKIPAMIGGGDMSKRDQIIFKPSMITSIHNTDFVGVINAPNLQRYKQNFEKDQIVYKKNDFKPDRLWYIREISPDGKITIATDDSHGFQSSQDMMQIVGQNDIHLVPIQSFQDDIPCPSPSPSPSNIPAGIHFAPVIKVVTGNNNSLLDENCPDNKNKIESNIEKTNNIDTLNQISTATEPEPARETTSSTSDLTIQTDDADSNKGFIENLVDFSKLIVKKI